MSRRRIVALAVCVFVGLATLSPNPFGNNPDIIADESYFLTSSLQALQHHTLPGWEFSSSGNYYGGPQTYLDFVVLIPVVGVIFLLSHVSVLATEGYVALHTGDLLHAVRLVNGAVALAALAGCYWYVARRRVPLPLGMTLALFALLLYSSSIVLQFLHTAKVWVLYIAIVGVIDALFIADRYYRTHEGRPFLSASMWAGLLLWATAILCFQNYVGAFSTAIVALYTIWLGDLSVRDFWAHVWRYWYWFVGLAALQVSFLYRALFVNLVTGSFSEISTLTPDHHIIWSTRLWYPLKYLALGGPLAVALFALAGLALLWQWRRTDARDRRYIAIALVHPVVTYAFFHVLVGFSSAPRYGVMLVVAVSFSAAILVSYLGIRAVRGALVVAGIFAAVVCAQSVRLYWQQSSEVSLLRAIEANHNQPTEAFVTEFSALRLTLPTNVASLALLDEKRADMSRFEFMREHQDVVASSTSFKPVTVTTYDDQELRTAVKHLSPAYHVWTITTDCAHLCSAEEQAATTCFEVNIASCRQLPQEVNLLPDFLSFKQLGNPYIVRRVNI